MPFLSAKKRHNSEKTLNSEFFFQGCIHNANNKIITNKAIIHFHFILHSYPFISVCLLSDKNKRKQKIVQKKEVVNIPFTTFLAEREDYEPNSRNLV